jgi:hypothetical protein
VEFIIKLLQGKSAPLWLASGLPNVTWGDRAQAQSFRKKADALVVAERLRSYGTVAVEPQG